MSDDRVSKKISVLAHEKPSMAPKQRVAIALSMNEAGRLGPRGAYRRVKRDRPRRVTR